MEETVDNLWPVIAPIAVLAIVGLWNMLRRFISWVSREVAENVVRAIGDSLRERWNEDMAEALAPIYKELRDNGGTSLKDIISDVRTRLANVEQQMETEIMRDRFDDPDGYPV